MDTRHKIANPMVQVTMAEAPISHMDNPLKPKMKVFKVNVSTATRKGIERMNVTVISEIWENVTMPSSVTKIYRYYSYLKFHLEHNLLHLRRL